MAIYYTDEAGEVTYRFDFDLRNGKPLNIRFEIFGAALKRESIEKDGPAKTIIDWFDRQSLDSRGKIYETGVSEIVSGYIDADPDRAVILGTIVVTGAEIDWYYTHEEILDAWAEKEKITREEVLDLIQDENRYMILYPVGTIAIED